jgi:MOSC domain-containing protein YiiM
MSSRQTRQQREEEEEEEAARLGGPVSRADFEVLETAAFENAAAAAAAIAAGEQAQEAAAAARESADGGYPGWVPLAHSSHGGKMQAIMHMRYEHMSAVLTLTHT